MYKIIYVILFNKKINLFQTFYYLQFGLWTMLHEVGLPLLLGAPSLLLAQRLNLASGKRYVSHSPKGTSSRHRIAGPARKYRTISIIITSVASYCRIPK